MPLLCLERQRGSGRQLWGCNVDYVLIECLPGQRVADGKIVRSFDSPYAALEELRTAPAQEVEQYIVDGAGDILLTPHDLYP